MITQTEIQKLFETPQYIYLRSFFQGVEVIFAQNKSNPCEIYFSAESVARVMGYASANEMLGDDSILDALNKYMRETGKAFPIINIVDNSEN